MVPYAPDPIPSSESLQEGLSGWWTEGTDGSGSRGSGGRWLSLGFKQCQLSLQWDDREGDRSMGCLKHPTRKPGDTGWDSVCANRGWTLLSWNPLGRPPPPMRPFSYGRAAAQPWPGAAPHLCVRAAPGVITRDVQRTSSRSPASMIGSMGRARRCSFILTHTGTRLCQDGQAQAQGSSGRPPTHRGSQLWARMSSMKYTCPSEIIPVRLFKSNL